MMCGMKRTGLFVIVFCVSLLNINAQAPGYMGKRFSAGYGLYANPAFNSIALNYGNSPINTLHELFIEYAIGKKFSLGLSGQFFRYKYNNKADANLDQTNSIYGLNSISSHPSGHYLIKGRNYKFYGKFYRDRYLAPWGKYFLLGIVLNRYITEYNPDEMGLAGTTNVMSYATGNSVRQSVFYNDFGSTRQSFNNVDVFFGNGNSRIFANKIVLDYGYTIGCLAMTRMFLDALNYETLTTNEYIKRTSKTRTAAINRFNFFLKIGYLF